MKLFFNLFKNSNSPQLSDVLRDGAFLVDVRTPAEFSTGSVKGAVNIPLDSIAVKLSKFKEKKNIIVFCRSGYRSARAKSILEQNGFQDIINGGSVSNVQHIINNLS